MTGTPLRAAFFGTPEFAVPALDALHASVHQIEVVYTQPPRPAGRGHRMRESPVAQRAGALDLAVRTPGALRDSGEAERLRSMRLDVGVVVAYGLLLPDAILNAFRLGCVNVHASLLPRWRGAAPVERAIMAGDAMTGVSLMLMDEGLDTGPVLDRCEVPIGSDMTGGRLRDVLATCGADRLAEALSGLAAGTLVPVAQPEGAVYASKLGPADRVLDWESAAEQLERQVRALHPVPGARALLPLKGRSELVKVWRARPVKSCPAPAGTVLDDRLTVACGVDGLRLLEVQRPGGRRLDAAAFLRGTPVPASTVLPAPGSNEG
ncbi:MAG: methionyl-tRNA formyltransferase [Rhodospirillales bacterium]|nr:methionyl-tRNA formyltransferase [Rhodospirillales bacterium]